MSFGYGALVGLGQAMQQDRLAREERARQDDQLAREEARRHQESTLGFLQSLIHGDTPASVKQAAAHGMFAVLSDPKIASNPDKMMKIRGEVESSAHRQRAMQVLGIKQADDTANYLDAFSGVPGMEGAGAALHGAAQNEPPQYEDSLYNTPEEHQAQDLAAKESDYQLQEKYRPKFTVGGPGSVVYGPHGEIIGQTPAKPSAGDTTQLKANAYYAAQHPELNATAGQVGQDPIHSVKALREYNATGKPTGSFVVSTNPWDPPNTLVFKPSAQVSISARNSPLGQTPDGGGSALPTRGTPATTAAPTVRTGRTRGGPATSTAATVLPTTAAGPTTAPSSASPSEPVDLDTSVRRAVQSDPPGTNPDAIASLPRDEQAFIKGLANYDLDPAGIRGRSGNPNVVKAKVLQYRPDWNEANYAVIKKDREHFTSGLAAQNVTAINTAIQHVNELSQSVEELGNSNIPGANIVRNFVGRQTGNTNIQSALAAVKAKGLAVSDELSKVFKGGNTNSDKAIEMWLSQLASSNTPVEMQSTIDSALNLLSGRVKSLEDQYHRAFSMPADYSVLSSESRAILKQLNPAYLSKFDRGQTAAADSTTVPATTPAVPTRTTSTRKATKTGAAKKAPPTPPSGYILGNH